MCDSCNYMLDRCVFYSDLFLDRYDTRGSIGSFHRIKLHSSRIERSLSVRFERLCLWSCRLCVLRQTQTECLSFISHVRDVGDVYYIWNELPLRYFGIMYRDMLVRSRSWRGTYVSLIWSFRGWYHRTHSECSSLLLRSRGNASRGCTQGLILTERTYIN